MANTLKSKKETKVSEENLNPDKEAPVNVTEVVKDERTSKIAGLILLLLTLFLFVAFTSYLFTWQEDQDKVQLWRTHLFSTSDVKVNNQLGFIGAFVAYQIMFNGFGLAAYLFCAFTFVIGVNLFFELNKQLAQLMEPYHNYDVSMTEIHHTEKKDAPSGTALQFGRIVAEQMGQERHVHGREGRTGKRPLGEIGYHAVRTGDNVGEHTIVFGMLGETIDLTVRGHTRDSYAYGALAAAKYVVSRPAGLYSMADVLGLS